MIIVCNQKEADKKLVKKFHKIIISEHLEDVPDSKRISHFNQFLPPMKLFHEFCNGDINQKKYYKKYCKYIRENDQLYASVVLLMLAYDQAKHLVLVCSSEEMKYGYMNFFATILREDFGVDVCSYNNWKENGCKEKSNIDKKALKQAVKQYRYILNDEDDDNYTKKKDKKKKKNKKKETHTFSDLSKTKKKKNKSIKEKDIDFEKAGFVRDVKKKKGPTMMDGFLMDTIRVVRISKIK